MSPISQLTDELCALIDCLDGANVGYPRATRDIDLMIRRESLEAATKSIEALGDTIPGGLIPFGVETPNAREVFRVSRILSEEQFTLGFILVTPVFDDVWSGRIEVQLNNRRISVVSRDGLVKMKQLAGRMRDLTDLDELGIERDDS